jgi:hypothetical protein
MTWYVLLQSMLAQLCMVISWLFGMLSIFAVTGFQTDMYKFRCAKIAFANWVSQNRFCDFLKDCGANMLSCTVLVHFLQFWDCMHICWIGVACFGTALCCTKF